MKTIRLSPEAWEDLMLCKNSFDKIKGDRVSVRTIVEDLVNRHLSSYLKRETAKRITKLKKEQAKRKALIKKHVESIKDVSHLCEKYATNADLLVK